MRLRKAAPGDDADVVSVPVHRGVADERVGRAREDGFTLIELVIVIVLVGILAGIVVFAVGGARSESDPAPGRKNVSTTADAYPLKPAA